MNRALSSLLIFCVFLLPAGITHAQPLDRLLEATAAQSFSGLQILEAEEAQPTHLRWVVWGEGVGEGQHVHLALFARARGRATKRWLMSYPNGYLPRIQLARRWRYGDAPVLLLIFQYGAAVEMLVAFGLDRHGIPVGLDERMAGRFNVRDTARGLRIIGLGGTAVDPTLCFRPRADAARLEAFDCPEERGLYENPQ